MKPDHHHPDPNDPDANSGWKQFSRRHPGLTHPHEPESERQDPKSRRSRWLLMAVVGIGLLLGLIKMIMPGLKPLAISSELVVGTRETPTSYMRDKVPNKDGVVETLIKGFDHDLVQAFAKSQGKTVRFVVAENEAALERLLDKGEVHMAAAWLNRRFVEAPGSTSGFRISRPYDQSELVVVQSDQSLPLQDEKALHAKKVHAMPASSHQVWIQRLNKKYIWPELLIEKNRNEFELLEAVSNGEIEYVVLPKSVYQIGLNYYSGLDSSLTIGREEPVFWVFPKRASDVLIQAANQFIGQAENNGTLRQLRDRYFGAVSRLQAADRSVFLARIKSHLPLYLAQFKRAQITSGYDWRLLAALAYQESKWDSSAVSKTGVRGLMMLTADTADRLGVRNRLDPYESIMGGAKYMDMLRDDLPASVPEPDRTWMAIASYNVGPGSIKAARKQAQAMGLNPNSWADMKKALPLLGETPSGVKIRGGEAVVTAENVRMYYAILSRLYPASSGFSLTAPATRTYDVSTPAKGGSSGSGSGLR